MIEAAGQCQKSERRSLHERRIQIETEDAELKVSGSEMMRGFTDRKEKEIRHMWGSENTLADGFLRFPYKSVVCSQLVKCRNGSESVKHVPFVHLRPTNMANMSSKHPKPKEMKQTMKNLPAEYSEMVFSSAQRWNWSCSQSKMTLFFSLFFPISLTWPLSWRDYNFLRISYLFHILITIVHFFVILHDLG